MYIHYISCLFTDTEHIILDITHLFVLAENEVNSTRNKPF